MTDFRFPLRLSPSLLLSLMLATSASAQEAFATSVNSPMHLTLPAAVDMAIAHNRKIALARLSVQDSEEQKRIAESHYYPEIANKSDVKHITELEGIVIPAGALSHGTSAGAIPSQTLRIDQGGSTSYISATALNQPLTQLLKIHEGVKAADADLRLARTLAADVEDAIALQVHELYYRFLIEQMRASVAEDAVTAASVAEQEAQKGVQEGRLLNSVELASRADLLDKRRAVLISKLNTDDLTLQLDDALGLSLGTRLSLDPNELGETAGMPSRAEAIALVLERSPTILEARQTVEKAKAGLAAAHDAYIPNVTAYAHYDYQSGLPFLVHNFGSFGGSLTYDLFDGGKREAEVRAARIKLAMAQMQLAQVQNDASIQISAAYDKAEQLEQLSQVSQLALDARDESYRIERQRSQVDAALESSVANAHAAATGARFNLLSSQLDLYLVKHDIKRLLGERPR